eukprot:TRINITY_DN2614_c0_g1_i1.p1 TRINITY_DN2614_c0_g1~~TRINITY_DN2614_c0_g1_i1.p1  ORF type:complete len:141 (-),score=11.03 TRINITY_DN2614_c0_g1_i1:9-431(-)
MELKGMKQGVNRELGTRHITVVHPGRHSSLTKLKLQQRARARADSLYFGFEIVLILFLFVCLLTFTFFVLFRFGFVCFYLFIYLFSFFPFFFFPPPCLQSDYKGGTQFNVATYSKYFPLKLLTNLRPGRTPYPENTSPIM